jgi:ATP-dependent RNA helicase DDX49/DBP8
LKEFPHIVIATPGRLAAHFTDSDPDIMSGFQNLKYLVIDEADRIVNEECFEQDLKTIVNAIPAERTTYLFSATMLAGIEKRKEIFEGRLDAKEPKLTKPIKVFDTTKGFPKTIDDLTQSYLLVPNKVKELYLINFIKSSMSDKKIRQTIIFCSTVK